MLVICVASSDSTFSLNYLNSCQISKSLLSDATGEKPLKFAECRLGGVGRVSVVLVFIRLRLELDVLLLAGLADLLEMFLSFEVLLDDAMKLSFITLL